MVESFSLSVAAMDLVWAELGLGQQVFPFQVPSVGELMSDRERLAGVVFGDLTSRGLTDGQRLIPLVSETLTVLARSTMAIAVVANLEHDQHLFARVAGNGRTGVVAVLSGQMFHFTRISPAGLLAAALELLPDAPAGIGHSVTITAEQKRPRRSDDEEGGALFRSKRDSIDVADPQRLAAKAMFERPKHRAGYFVAFGQGRDGKERTATGLGWFDNDSGRYLMRHHKTADGREWSSIAPADHSRLAQQLADLSSFS